MIAHDTYQHPNRLRTGSVSVSTSTYDAPATERATHVLPACCISALVTPYLAPGNYAQTFSNILPTRFDLKIQPPSGAALKRLMRELNELRRNPPEGIRIQTNEEDMLDVTGVIEGPGGCCLHSPFSPELVRRGQVTKLGRVGSGPIHFELRLIVLTSSLQREHRMPEGTLKSGLVSQNNSPPLPLNVSPVALALLRLLISAFRLVCHQDLPRQRRTHRRDLCEYAEEGLEVDIRHRTHTCDRQMPLDLP